MSNNPYAAPAAVLADPALDDGTYTPKILSWHGRIGRLRYLAYSYLLMFVLALLFGILVAALPTQNGMAKMLGWFVYMPIAVVALTMAKRRMNDLDNSSWLALLILLPFVNFFVGLYLIFGSGTQRPNSYGPAPVKNSRLLVLVGWLLPVVFVIGGILAAIAIPAYQSYVLRAKHAAVQQHP